MKAEDIRFISLSSGSSGNCYFLGNVHSGILVDAGIPAGRIRKALLQAGISLQAVRGVLISHDHSDHTRGLELLIRKSHLPVHTTERVWSSILARKIPLAGVTVHRIGLQQAFDLAGFSIEAFKVSHDAPETIGFHIQAGDSKITIATDLGHICETVAPYLKAANLLVIESNYDEKTLREGSYPHFLKARILSDQGHLGNHQTSGFLAGNMSEDLRHICLAHLSKSNNTPELALQTLQRVLAEKGSAPNGHPKITVLKRDVPSEPILLNGCPS